MAVGGSLLALVAVGYLVSSSYLMLRDDILGAAIARQARVQHAYEDRIAALRSQVDRVTSYRLLDQQVMETKVAELITRQSVLARRTGKLAPVLERVEGSGVRPFGLDLDELPVPAIRKGEEAGGRILFEPQAPGVDPLTTASISANPETPYVALSRLDTSLDSLASDQFNQIEELTQSVRQIRGRMVADANQAGLDIEDPAPKVPATGGPFIPAAKHAERVDAFDIEIETLNKELDALEQVRGAVRAFPISNPAPGHRITSGFGKRRDPLIGRSAFHAGIDMGLASGTPVHATGAGTVIRAGRNGGYGKMVEIRHASGLTTRYAHLSRILVKKGQAVSPGMVIAKSGTTGRSTGPHLHYEVRKGDKAVNPMTYMKAGTRLGEYL